ncbi:hypothetical protein BD410DRAFT_806033 [Rickenella mellea]|uniref:Uncharacterized protein n=1 Tax=Rickenella mellea TaxID=50990 RepID=A0A4Y7PVC1_9AGAM|nr:hypothetical protein BD410DRAFT_806033 [Rickenella mellea]
MSDAAGAIEFVSSNCRGSIYVSLVFLELSAVGSYVIIGLLFLFHLILTSYHIFEQRYLLSRSINTPCLVEMPSTVTFASPIPVLVYHGLVFGLTVAKTIKHALAMRKLGLHKSLCYFILRDGTIANFCTGAVNIIVTSASDWIGVLPYVSLAVSNVLTSRLVLNLRRESHVPAAGSLALPTIDSVPEAVFAQNSLLGNLGAPLRMDPDDDEIEDI